LPEGPIFMRQYKPVGTLTGWNVESTPKSHFP
jgi:hypothetical protein